MEKVIISDEEWEKLHNANWFMQIIKGVVMAFKYAGKLPEFNYADIDQYEHGQLLERDGNPWRFHKRLRGEQV